MIKILISCLFKDIENRIMLSEKFGLYLSNPDEETVEWIKEEVNEELHHRKYAVKRHNTQTIQNYDLDAIINSPYYTETFADKEMKHDAISQIIRKVICIYNDECQHSLLHKINPYIDNPTCERTIESKFISFINEIDRASDNNNTKSISIPICIDDYTSYYKQSRLIAFMNINTKDKVFDQRYKFKNHGETVEFKIKELLKFCKKIDEYINTETDFFVFNYLIDCLSTENDVHAFGIIKLFSLIELLIINDDSSIHMQIKNKLPCFLSNYPNLNDQEKIEKASKLYKIRNKIAHREYIDLKRELNKYKNEFMSHYYFDFFEYSEDNWIINSVYFTLKDCVFKIISEMLKNKQEILNIKLSN